MLIPQVAVPLIGMPGLWEWVIIGLAIAIFFGASKLPKLGKGLGEGIRNFKKGIKGDEEAKLPAKTETESAGEGEKAEG
jgi:sec-independent protein translocase protein TatA